MAGHDRRVDVRSVNKIQGLAFLDTVDSHTNEKEERKLIAVAPHGVFKTAESESESPARSYKLLPLMSSTRISQASDNPPIYIYIGVYVYTFCEVHF